MPYNISLIARQVKFSLSFDMRYVSKYRQVCTHTDIIKRQKDIKKEPEDRFTVEKDYEGKCVTRKRAGQGSRLMRLSTLVVPPGLLCAIKDFQQGKLFKGEMPRSHTT